MNGDVWHMQRIITIFLVAEGIENAEIYCRLSVVISSDTSSCMKVFE